MLQANGLTKYFGKLCALDGLDLRVPAGEIFCLLGANGAGKTTTLNLFLDFLKPCAGSAQVGGLVVAEHPQTTKRTLAYVPENVALYSKMTGFENLSYFLGLAGVARTDGDKRGLLDQVGLQAEAVDRRVETYSKGMRQKVALAIALGRDSKALLLDEPTSGLDPGAAKTFTDLIQTFRDQGLAILMTTHDLFRARAVSDRIGVMRQGRLVGCYSTGELSTGELEQLYLQHMSEA